MTCDQHVFSIIPIEVALDGRLSKTHIRVLIALLSFRGKNTNLVWPSRESLMERCGLPETRISTATTELVSLGWLKKTGKGGFSKATVYEITVPNQSETVTEPVTVVELVTVTEPVTVTESVTVTEPVTRGVTEPVTQTVTEPVTRIEVTNEVTNEVTMIHSAHNDCAEADSGAGRRNNRFVRPSIDDVRGYCIERGNNVNPEQWLDHYTSNGWKVGRNPMKDWKAAIRTWERSSGGKNEKHPRHDTRSRAKRFSDKLDEIARRDIEENGFADDLGKRNI